MKILDAFWEKRNMALETTEIVIEPEDTAASVKNTLKSVQSEYIVVKLPIEQIGIAAVLGSMGFTFAEAMTHSKHNMLLLEPEERKKKLLAQIDMVPAEEADLENIFSHIHKGLYHTDRVSLDPYFPNGIAARRYIGWIQDELSRGLVMYKFLYEGEMFGYVGIKKLSEHIFQDIINGIFEEYQGQGLAFSITYKSVKMLKEQECQCLCVDVSSNNLPSLKRCQHNGYQIAGFTYVFVKHNLDREAYLARISGDGCVLQ